MKHSGENDDAIKNMAKSAVNEDDGLFDHSFADFETRKWKLEKDRKETEHRESLSKVLKWISIVWLFYTGVVFILYGMCKLKYEASTINTFMLSSLIEVFALWAIALKYFFHV